MPDTKRRNDETERPEQQQTEQGLPDYFWQGELPLDEEPGFAGQLAIARDATVDALSEFRALMYDEGVAGIKAGIERTAKALGAEDAVDVDVKTVQGVEDVLRWLQRARRLAKQLEGADACHQLEEAVGQLETILTDELGWSEPNASDGGGGDQEGRATGSSLAGPADCSRLWRGNYPAADRGPTAEAAAVQAHDRVRAAARYLQTGGELVYDPEGAVESVRVAAEGLEEFLERVCQETGGDAPFVKPSRAEYRMLEEVQEKLERAVNETTPKILAEIHRDLHRYLDEGQVETRGPGESVEDDQGRAPVAYVHAYPLFSEGLREIITDLSPGSSGRAEQLGFVAKALEDLCIREYGAEEAPEPIKRALGQAADSFHDAAHVLSRTSAVYFERRKHQRGWGPSVLRFFQEDDSRE